MAGCPLEGSSELILTDLTIPILVQQVESDAKILLVKETGPVNCSRNEFTVVYLAVLVRVELVDELMPILRTSTHQSKHLAHALL